MAGILRSLKKKKFLNVVYQPRSVHIGKNCALGLEYRKVLKTSATVFPDSDRPAGELNRYTRIENTVSYKFQFEVDISHLRVTYFRRKMESLTKLHLYHKNAYENRSIDIDCYKRKELWSRTNIHMTNLKFHLLVAGGLGMTFLWKREFC